MNHILVCVTEQVNCSRLIRKGRALADLQNARLTVLHVRTRQKTMMGNPDISTALNTLYADARAADADMEIIASPNVEHTIAEYVQSHGVTHLIIGCSPMNGQPTMRDRLAALIPDREIIIAEE